MVLPEGATRHDLLMTSTRVFEYVKNSAVSWTHHFAQSSRYSTANGSRYIITGVDKTSACANLAFPYRPPTVEMFASYQNGIRPMKRMSIARGATADENLSLIPNNLCVFMRGIRIGLGRTKWIENVDERSERRTFYTEIFVDTPRLGLPFLKTIIQFGKDEQVLSLNDKSFFVVVDLPFPICAIFIFLTHLFQHAFHPSDIAALPGE
jgi:hypothetical protein